MLFNTLAFARFFLIVFVASWLLTRRRAVLFLPWLAVLATALFHPALARIVPVNTPLGTATLWVPSLLTVLLPLTSFALVAAVARQVQDAPQDEQGGYEPLALHHVLASLAVSYTALAFLLRSEPVSVAAATLGIPLHTLGPLRWLLVGATLLLTARALRARRVRLLFLLGASYVFYAHWDVRFLPLIWLSSTVDWWLGHTIAKARSERARRRWLWVTVVLNLGVLAVFKYLLFAVKSTGASPSVWASGVTAALGPNVGGAVAPLLDALGFWDPTHALQIVGISFFTFESMSYVIDVYRRELEPHESYVEYLTFVAFFPHLVAGPIVRPRDLLPQLAGPARFSAAIGSEGLLLVLIGLTKKVAIADTLALNLVDRVFDAPLQYSPLDCYLGVVGYAVQIYCDFSGYTDVALGVSLLLGVRLPLNFDAPYTSRDLVDFWRRWHISLSTWLRDYLYIPLGGNRHGRARTYVNLLLTMLLGGLWHGPAWTFVVWGGIHGFGLALTRAAMEASRSLRALLLTLLVGTLLGTVTLAAILAIALGTNVTRLGELGWALGWGAVVALAVTVGALDRALTQRRQGRWWLAVLATLATFHVVCFCWVFFRAPTFTDATVLLARISTFAIEPSRLAPSALLALALGLASHYVPASWLALGQRRLAEAPVLVQALALLAFALALREVASLDAVPFVYFQF